MPSATSILAGVRWGIITQPGRQVGVMACGKGAPTLASKGMGHRCTQAMPLAHTHTPGHITRAHRDGRHFWPQRTSPKVANPSSELRQSPFPPSPSGCGHSNLSWYVTHRSMQKAGLERRTPTLADPPQPPPCTKKSLGVFLSRAPPGSTQAQRMSREGRAREQRWGSSPRPPWWPHPLTTSPEPGLAELGWPLSGDGT